jgi:hypothetical protein
MVLTIFVIRHSIPSPASHRAKGSQHGLSAASHASGEPGIDSQNVAP